MKEKEFEGVELPCICLNCSNRSFIDLRVSCIPSENGALFPYCSVRKTIPHIYRTICNCFAPLDTQLEFNFE